ncbi:hypothetical protein V8C35DRAFT_329339 [Trichoderma chlorosporum]
MHLLLMEIHSQVHGYRIAEYHRLLTIEVFRLETRYANTGNHVSCARPRAILFPVQRREEGNGAPAISAQSPSAYNFQLMDDSSSLEMLHRIAEVNGAPMTSARPLLPMSPSTALPAHPSLTLSPNFLSYPWSIAQQCSRGYSFQAFEAERFEYILNFTSQEGIGVFNFLTSAEKGTDNWHLDNVFTIDDMLVFDYEAGSKQMQDLEEGSRATTTLDWLFDSLLPQTQAICEMLLKLPARFDALTLGDHDETLEQQCLDFFNPLNLRRFLDSYWKRWHRHCPIIHPSSFNPSQAPPELLLAMVLLGACFTKSPEDRQNARKWLEPAERLVFALPWLSRGTQGGRADPVLTRYNKLRILQSAILVCVLQTWEGSDEAKERIRRLRYSYVARAYQELSSSPPIERIGIDLAATLQHWHEFILEEEIIRTKYVCFHARTGEEFFASVQRFCPDYPMTREMRIHRAVQMLCDTTNASTYTNLPQLTDLGAFILISAIHSIIYCQQVSCFAPQNTIFPLFTSLDKWLSLWNKRISPLQPGPEAHALIDHDESAAGPSFLRHSREFYTLALAKLESIEKLHTVGQNDQFINADRGNVRQLISDVKRAWPSRPETSVANAV